MRRILLLTGFALLVCAGILLGLRAAGVWPRPTGGLGSDDVVNNVPAMPGLGEAFDAEVKKVGQISPDEFARRFPSKAKYLPKVTWDPTTGKH